MKKAVNETEANKPRYVIEGELRGEEAYEMVQGLFAPPDKKNV